MIYLDNAATSYPKPPQVLKAMNDALERAGGNPGRSGHRLSIAAARLVYDTRELIAEFFNAPDPMRVIFTSNATHAINQALIGILKHGDRVVTTSIEHNAVMRPLRHLEKKGIKLDVVACAPDGTLDIKCLARAVSSDTRLVVATHASNVVGTIMPISEMARIAHEAGALFMVDAAQTAGALPIDMKAIRIDLLAFTGHKELMGPPGVGGLILGENVDPSKIEPLMRGGTGSQSELEEQPDFLPDKFESGTANTVGIAGLKAGTQWVKTRGLKEIRVHTIELTRALMNGLSEIPGVKVYGTLDADKSVGVISITVRGKRVSEIGLRLDEEYAVLTRVGLHCAPSAHKTIGSFPEGTVRLAPGAFTTMADINTTVKAIREIVET